MSHWLRSPHGRRADASGVVSRRCCGWSRWHGWARWANLVARHPIPAVVVSVTILLVLALPARNLHFGQADIGALPARDEEAG